MSQALEVFYAIAQPDYISTVSAQVGIGLLVIGIAYCLAIPLRFFKVGRRFEKQVEDTMKKLLSAYASRRFSKQEKLRRDYSQAIGNIHQESSLLGKIKAFVGAFFAEKPQDEIPNLSEYNSKTEEDKDTKKK